MADDIQETSPVAQRNKRLPISFVIPSLITVAATCSALTGVRFALEGKMEFAVMAVILAALLDGLDGRMARLLNAASNFGAQMDSLSDFVAFGVSPAFILYFWHLNSLAGGLGGLGWIVTLFLAICCGLRLARFNSRMDKLPDYAGNFFQGVPAPLGALLSLMPLMASFVMEDVRAIVDWRPSALFVAVWTVAVGLLMVSEIPTFAFKKMKIKREILFPLLSALVLVLAAATSLPWATALFILFAYLVSIPWSVKHYNRLKQEAAQIYQAPPLSP